MLRVEKYGHFTTETITEGGFFTRRTRKIYRFHTKSAWTFDVFEQDQYDQLWEEQEKIPVPLMHDPEGSRTWWMFKRKFYVEDERYSAEEIRILLLDREAKRKRRIESAKRRVEQDSRAPAAGRESIPEDVRMFVWRRDQGRCVKCGSQENLEFDHIIPVSKGGSSTARNIQLLCQKCNREKGNKLV